jgi:DUF4097 and DUF4098 domain-containing protein YvlB
MNEIERTMPLDGVTGLEVKLHCGNLTIKTEEREDLWLRAQSRGDLQLERDLQIERQGDRVFIRQAPLSWFGMGRSGAIDLQLRLPSGRPWQVKGEIGQGEVTVSDLEGGLRVKTGQGEAQVTSFRGQLTVNLGQGDAALSRISGPIKAAVGQGDICLQGWQGEGEDGCSLKCSAGTVEVIEATGPRLEASSAMGDCLLRDVRLPHLRAETSKGDVTCDGEPGNGRWVLKTALGDVTLTLPADANVRINAVTSLGEIRSEFPLVQVGRQGPMGLLGGRMVGAIGQEAAQTEIELATAKGDIRLQARRPRPSAPPSAAAAPSPEPPAADDVDAARLQVLEALSRGELSVEEAEELLQRLGI